VAETTLTATFDGAGLAEPVQRAILSTKLMGNVTAVLVQEGQRVERGALLARIDARDVEAKRQQVDASLAAADAMYQDAVTQAGRFRALYADSAATRAQLDQVETGLARAEAGLKGAQGARDELVAMGEYTALRAPFPGIITARHVDPGAFVAPGTPILEIQDASRLRISTAVPPRVAAGLRRGDGVAATIEGHPVHARVEGIVPAPAGAVYLVNAMVDNAKGRFLPGSAATLRIPDGTRQALVIPASAIIREGDLTGVRVRTTQGSELRWVRLGSEIPVEPAATGRESPTLVAGDLVEVLSGLRRGDVVVGGDR
jgi:RND family efflux transporter MFP subunit